MHTITIDKKKAKNLKKGRERSVRGFREGKGKREASFGSSILPYTLAMIRTVSQHPYFNIFRI